MIKKTKLTISGIAKKSIENIELAKTQSKNSVVIEKKSNKFSGKSSFNKNPNTQRLKKIHLFIQKVQTLKKILLLHLMILKNVNLLNKEQREE